MKKKRFVRTNFKQKGFHINDATLFKRLHPEYKKMSNPDLRKLVFRLLTEYRDEIGRNQDGVVLASGFGEIALKYTETLQDILNQKLIKETGIPGIEHLNLRTNGKLGKVVWSSRAGSHLNQYAKFLRFTPHTSLSKLAKKAFTENPNNFKIAKCQRD